MSTAEIKVPVPAAVRPMDFPTWLPAMMVKELRQGLRARGFVGALVGFQTIMALVVVFAVADGGMSNGTYGLLQGSFWGVIAVMLLVVTPLRAIVGLRAEIDSRMIDLLLLTRLTAWRVVLSKLFSLLVQAALLVVAILPYGMARYFFGSVDVATELRVLAWMGVGCTLLTAGALWASALPKVVRIGLAVVGVVALQQIYVPVLSRLDLVWRPGREGMSYGELAMVIWNSALLIALCLIGAVRRLAPPAENLSPWLRALPIAGLVGWSFASVDTASRQIAVVAVLTAAVAMLELGALAVPRVEHWRGWVKRSKWHRRVVRLVLPGWASAFEWLLVATGMTLTASWFAPEPAYVISVTLTGAAALAVPVLLLSLIKTEFPQRAAAYGLILGAGSLLSAVAAMTAVTVAKATTADVILGVLPISSFWWSVKAVAPLSVPVALLQAVVALAVLGLTWWRAAPYRAQLKEFAAEAEEARPHE